MTSSPYIYSKFLGVNSFIKTLNDSDTEYTVFDDSFDDLFEKYQGLINRDDTLKTGVLSRDGQHIFFVEVGIRITKSYSSYFIYIFDRHPKTEDIDYIINSLETLINENLDKIDPSSFTPVSTDENKGGHMIN